MYHGDTNERQRLELHMVRKERGKGKWQRTPFSLSFLTMCSYECCLSFVSFMCSCQALDRACPHWYKKRGMHQWLLVVTSDPAAKGSAIDLEVAGAGPVHCHFFLPPSFHIALLK